MSFIRPVIILKKHDPKLLRDFAHERQIISLLFIHSYSYYFASKIVSILRIRTSSYASTLLLRFPCLKQIYLFSHSSAIEITTKRKNANRSTIFLAKARAVIVPPRYGINDLTIASFRTERLERNLLVPSVKESQRKLFFQRI